MKNFRKITDVKDLAGKIVLVRANLDVPVNKGEIQDSFRIEAAAKTLQYLISQNAKVVIVGHLGRPKGKYVDDLSLMPIRFELGRRLAKQIKFANIEACANSIKFLENGDVLMLENIRFFESEESNDPKTRKKFIKQLTDLCDLYVNDCFALYRKHASVYEAAKLLPSYAGIQIIEEISKLSKLLEKPESPYIAVIGGAKLDTKIPILKKLASEVDKIIIGGAMAYTFLKSSGIEIGKSKIDESEIKTAKEILGIAKTNGVEIVLPVDHICAKEFSDNAEAIEVTTQSIPKDLMGMDIGSNTLVLFREIIESAKSILWNGPMGVFEFENFNKGTESIGEYIALSSPKNCYKVAGGGDTILAMNLLKIKFKRFDHVSTGGGMMLQFLAGDNFDILDILTGEQKI